MADSPSKIRLSIWRDFIPSKALMLRKDDDEEHRFLTNDCELQQEVYTWNMKEDPFGGVSDEKARNRLHELLIDRFEASQSPSKRRVEVLLEFLSEAQLVIDAEQAEWKSCEDAADDEDAPYRINPLLALKLHLEWIVSMFIDQPGVSVSIR